MANNSIADQQPGIEMTLLERLRQLSCSDKLSQDELDTVMDAIRAIDQLQRGAA